MQTRTVEQVESWDARPFSGGFRELHELADDDFSGAVVADDVWSFFLNGRVVGVFQGDIDDVANASGSVYAAPDPSLPLLFTMQERGGETQAKYFTNDTAVAEADETLRDANFTGYLELSENVLSGDYYVSYYGGKSMSTAFVGQSERLVTGEEAFEKANDEVGVFEVRKVSMNITEIPAPEDGQDDTAATAAPEKSAETAADQPTVEDETADASTGAAPIEAAEPEERSTGDATTADAESPAAAEPAGDAERTTAQGDETGRPPNEPASGAAEAAEPEPGTDEGADPSQSGDPGRRAKEESAARDAEDGESMSDHERAVREWAAKDRDADEDAATESLFREEAEWRESTSIPALDPDESEPVETPEDGERRAAGREQAKRKHARAKQSEQTGSTGQNGGRAREGSAPQTSGRAEASRQKDAQSQLSKLRSAVEARDRRIDELESDLASAESAREDLESTVEELREERSELRARIDDLESKLESAQVADAGGGGSAASDIPRAEALSGTNLFVRYGSKGKPTLESLTEGTVDPEAVNDNLRLEHHTQFDLEGATVEGEPFERFLEDSGRYRFVAWLVRALPYELLDSGATAELQDVYDAVPAFDRIEFDGTVDVESDEGEPVSHDFDVVVRDRMGDPLVVAEINDSREPVHGDAMEGLVTGATAIGEVAESLAGAFYVTASFFEPGALEHAKEAASAGGFFSRSDHESYVKVSRKRGYHLCLVEDRHDAFHLTVPEL